MKTTSAIPIAFAVSLLAFTSISFAQSTVIYGNTSDRYGTLTGWENRGATVTFNDIGTFSEPIGGLAVSSNDGYAVSFESPSNYSIFNVNNPSVVSYDSATSVDYLDALVYDPFDGVVYAHSDQGLMHTFDPSGAQTTHGFLSGNGVDGATIQWGSHGDLAIYPDSNYMYQVGFDVSLQDDSSDNWHSLLLIDTNYLTNAIRIGQVSTDFGLIWGLAFDESGSLFGVTDSSYMIEIDRTNGSVLWSAPIVDTSNTSVAMWDLASNPHTTVPEPSGALLVAFTGILTLLRRRR